MKSRSILALTLIRLRRQRRSAARVKAHRRTRRLAFGLGAVIALASALLILGTTLTYASITHNLPAVEQMEILLNPTSGTLLQPAHLMDRSGQHLLAVLSPAGAERTYLPLEQISPHLVRATLAIVQPDFWESPGYVLTGWQDPDSHLTIAQQLAADLLLAGQPATPQRAIHERLLAAQLIAQYGHARVLEWYLNSLNYGHFAYGAEAAAQLYLDKTAADLSLGEAALLAAIGRSQALNPFSAPQAAEANRLQTLLTLQELGWLTAAESDAASQEQVTVADALPARLDFQIEAGVSPQFIDLVLNQLDATLGAGRAGHGGTVVFTSLDYDLQVQADCALRTQIGRLTGDTSPLSGVDGSACPAASLLPALPAEASAPQTGAPQTGAPQGSAPQTGAGALVLDPLTGQVLAAAGDLSPQPAGTAITPFIYLTGFARGLNPASLGWDIPGEIAFQRQEALGPVRLRIALVNDYLPPTADILTQMGVESVRAASDSFGLVLPTSGLLQADFDLSPFHLASAYAVFAADGFQTGQATPTTDLGAAVVLRVTHPSGTLWMDFPAPQTRQVVSPQLAYLVNHILSDEIARWPSLGRSNPLEIGVPAAVKASQSLDGSAAWTIGYTPERVVIIHLAGAGPSSGTAANGLWHALTRFVLQNLPSTGWEQPAGLVNIRVCDPSGLLPTAICPSVVDEIFLEGRQPFQPDSLFQAFEIDIETGQLATVFTPPELVVERVFMVVPALARAWATETGLETPPTSYDPFRTPAIQPDTHLTTPILFANEHGSVEIRGSASGEDFVSYRLEAGAGLNPERWILLGPDQTTPVSEGLLATWDTSGLDGLYVLRLVVLRRENRVSEALTQLTLDNTPPAITLLNPVAGAEFSLAESAYLTLLAEVEDPFLKEVVFSLDGEILGSFPAAPFGVLWAARPGSHLLRVIATDEAGNITQAEVMFKVLE